MHTDAQYLKIAEADYNYKVQGEKEKKHQGITTHNKPYSTTTIPEGNSIILSNQLGMVLPKL
jgi:hypothetical protein